jgi:hypothetical protein
MIHANFKIDTGWYLPMLPPLIASPSLANEELQIFE